MGRQELPNSGALVGVWGDPTQVGMEGKGNCTLGAHPPLYYEQIYLKLASAAPWSKVYKIISLKSRKSLKSLKSPKKIAHKKK